MGAGGDKKRGKLQYQRISVACSKQPNDPLIPERAPC